MRTEECSCLCRSKMSYISGERIKASNTVELNNKCGAERMMEVQGAAQEMTLPELEAVFFKLYCSELKLHRLHTALIQPVAQTLPDKNTV